MQHEGTRAYADYEVTNQPYCDWWHWWQVTFLADESNTHRVTQVLHGERLTLTLWFTLLPMHSEDVKVLQLLPQSTDGALYVGDASLSARAANAACHGLQDRQAIHMLVYPRVVRHTEGNLLIGLHRVRRQGATIQHLPGFRG